MTPGPRSRRAVALVVAAALVLLAGCVQPMPEHPERGSSEVAPPKGKGRQPLDVEEMNVTWRAPQDAAARAHDLEWHVEEAEWRDGIVTLRAIGPSDEGWDFLFTLNFRVDGPHPVQLVYNETLARENTFNFTYREAPFWSGRAIDRVAHVNASASWLDVLTLERGSADVGGRFHFEFEGACDAECPPDEGNGPYVTVLDGAFPKGRRH